MLRVSITWHNNIDKKHIITIINKRQNYVNHNKNTSTIMAPKRQLRIHPSKKSGNLRQPVWRPNQPQNALKKCSLIGTMSVSFCRLRKGIIRPNRTSYAKVRPKQRSTPQNRSQQRKVSVSCSPVDQTITYKIIQTNLHDLQQSHDKPRGIQT